MRKLSDSAKLLRWYDENARVLPWRRANASPYEVWLSEIMLQQTTVAAVIPYFRRFLERWPQVRDLAAAPVEDVMHAWAGLGYYSRARNLHACAQLLADKGFPKDQAGLQAVPGIGPYTAAAIAAIAFGQRATVVDGNVERVISRVFAVEDTLPSAKPRLRALAETLTPEERPGDYAQAIMDLGATVCTPRAPRCSECPWSKRCKAFSQGQPEFYPRKAPKAEKPTRFGMAFWLERSGSVLLERRPPKGLLGGMLALPCSPFETQLSDGLSFAPCRAPWRILPGSVRHTFTHFHLDLKIAVAKGGNGSGVWMPIQSLDDAGFPTLMRKAVRLVLSARSML
jgi:A/G-specific adenine glycosylase